MTPTPGAAIMNGFMHNIEGILWGYCPFIFFAMFVSAGLKEGLELTIDAVFRKRPAVVAAIAASVTAIIGCLAWSAWFNWLQMTSALAQGQSTSDMLAGLETAPLFIQMLTLVPLWTKVGLVVGAFFLLLVLGRLALSSVRRSAYR